MTRICGHISRCISPAKWFKVRSFPFNPIKICWALMRKKMATIMGWISQEVDIEKIFYLWKTFFYFNRFSQILQPQLNYDLITRASLLYVSPTKSTHRYEKFPDKYPDFLCTDIALKLSKWVKQCSGAQAYVWQGFIHYFKHT